MKNTSYVGLAFFPRRKDGEGKNYRSIIWRIVGIFMTQGEREGKGWGEVKLVPMKIWEVLGGFCEGRGMEVRFGGWKG